MAHRFIESSGGGFYNTYMEESKGGTQIKAVNRFEADADKEAGLPKRKAKVEVVFELKSGKVTIIKDGQRIFDEGPGP
jgi:hypothetical protein